MTTEMGNQDYFMDIHGLNYKGLNKDEALALFESFIRKHPLMMCDLDVQSFCQNNGEISYIWRPCIAMSFILDKSEICRLYPSNISTIDYPTPALPPL